MTNKTIWPSDIDDLRHEVRTRLEEIGNPRLSVAFAARMALAALPALGERAEERGFLWYWVAAEREKHLLAVCRASQVGWLFCVDFSMILHVDDDARAARADARADADAARIAAHTDLRPFIRRELIALAENPEPAAYLARACEFPPPFAAYRDAFLSRLRQMPTFDYWADWFQDRYDGKPIDGEILKKSLFLPEGIANRDPRAINRYLGEIAVDDKNRLPHARRLLARGDYEGARAELLEIPETDSETWQRIEAEFGFAFDFSLDAEADAGRRGKCMGRIEWRRRVFAVLGSDAVSRETENSAEERSGAGEERADVAGDTANARIEKPAETPETKPKKRLSPEQRGEKLERDTLRLLRRLFEFDEESEPKRLRQQRRGAQLGFDIKLEACLAANGKNVRCLVECKSHEKEIRFGDILEKLHDAKANQVNIDHWILIAPRARLGNVPDGIVDKWNAAREWPFQVQFWMADTEVWSLFGLAPGIYDDWIPDHPPGEPHPRDWSPEEREKVRQRWLGKLQPPLRLPGVWAEYVIAPDENGIFMENDDREDLKALRKEQRYIPFGALDEGGSPLPGGLEKAVRDWLRGDSRVGIVLGEFGDGKSAFTYMLAHALLEEFRANPADGWLPVRFPLRYFARPNTSAREFLRDRLEELGTGIREWNREIVEKRNPLAILDGMDEMSKSLTQEAVRKVVGILLDCCNRELERVPKILITCRRPFFEELAQRPYVTGKLADPAIFHIEPFGKAQVYEKLEKLLPPKQHSRLGALRRMHDPLGLAGKALFFRMVSQTLARSDADFSSETGIYRGYVEECLARKSDYLEGGQDMTGGELVQGMLSILEAIAREMHLSDRDYFCLGNLADEGGTGLSRKEIAAILWRDITDEKTGANAVRQVGVRSLLSRATGRVDERGRDAWPVEFCHRSVREYFVARGLESALREGLEGAKRAIERVDINHEVLRFTVELMRARTARGGHDYGRTLRELANLGRRDEHEEIDEAERNRRCRLGRTAITLLYKWSGELEANDWRRMLLDGAGLAGADLTGKDFYGASLRDANLNNAILDEADFRFADLTGVRLEEAGEIAAVSMSPDSVSSDGFFVAYRDGTVRRWSLDARSDHHPAVVFRLPEDAQAGRNGPLGIAALPAARKNPGLCLWDRHGVRFLDAEGETYRQVGRFSLANPCSAIAIGERSVAALAGEKADARRALLFDFSPDGPPTGHVFAMDSFVECAPLTRWALAGARADGEVGVWARGETGDETRKTALGNVPSPTCIAAHRPENGRDNASERFQVACGNRDGVVAAWRFTLDESGIPRDVEEIFREEIHEGAARALCFMDGEHLLTGGADGRIHRLGLPHGWDAHPPFELRLRCRGTRIEGLEGGKERGILRAARE
uniref:Pentapeptide repeat-containing protein n=1 Tax=Candidatus Kentrum sp. TC TaxID=2126339 RepID=A0A450ZSM7_9GAMM|nr:MAG: Pentapeptide repeat-containing protein [Candidatus Kentron sp. TC]